MKDIKVLFLLTSLIWLISCGSDDEPNSKAYNIITSCVITDETSEVKGIESKSGDAYDFYSNYKNTIDNLVVKYNTTYQTSSSTSSQKLANELKEQILVDFQKIQKELDVASLHKCKFGYEITVKTKVTSGEDTFQSDGTISISYAPNFSGLSVNIDISTNALWSNFGVQGLGTYQIFDKENNVPKAFPYKDNSYTGIAGVLLIMGYSSTGSIEPMAYDTSCPIETSLVNMLYIDTNSLDAVCPICDSRYDVLFGSGSPKSGKAVSQKVGLRQYKVRATSQGGYMITNN